MSRMHVLIQHMIRAVLVLIQNKRALLPSEKLSSSNPHLQVADDMKHVERKNTFISQQQEFVVINSDGDDEEKCEEQKASSRLL